MKPNIPLFLLFVLYASPSFAQKKNAKAHKTVYLMFAKNLPTKYIVDSGVANLVGRKSTTTLGVGLNLDYKLNQSLIFRTGAMVTAHFMGEITYGNTNGKPSGFNITRFDGQYAKGIEYIERMTLGIPIKVGYTIHSSNKYFFTVYGGLHVSTYFSTRNESISHQVVKLDNTLAYQYQILRDFNPNRVVKVIYISTPQIEWQLDIEGVYKFKKNGGIVFGIKSHLATNNLERANFVIWPDYPSHRSKGHYSVNRSYIGIYAGYRFGKLNQKK